MPNDGSPSARATGLPSTSFRELRSRLLRLVPLNDLTKLEETLGILIQVYDDVFRQWKQVPL